MKKFLCAVLAAVLCLGLAGCDSAGAISTYTIALEQMPKNLDPQVATGDEELLVITNTFDGLFEYRDGKISKNLCSDYTVSPDGLSYTFILRDDSSFYVNKNEQIPVTAHDFVFAFERILNPSTRSPYYNDFANIAQVTAEKDDVLLIKLREPDSNFIAKLCMSCAVPCNREFFESTKGAYGLTVKNILSNGPYTVNYLADDGSYATLIRVKNSQGSIDRIRISLMEKDTTSEALYNSDSISGYFADNSTEGISCADSAFNMYFNLNTPLLQNKNVRGALAYFCYGMENSGANLSAVKQNYSLFSDAITFGEFSLNSQINLARPSYMDSQNPKELLAQGMEELGTVKTGSLMVLIPNDVKYSVIVENINQMWQKKLGAFFTLEFLPSAEIEQRMAKGNFDIAFYSYKANNNNAETLLSLYSPYDENVAYYIESFKAGYLSTAEKLSAVENAHNHIIENAFVVPMCTDSAKYVHKSFFTNVEINPFGNIVNLKYAKVK